MDIRCRKTTCKYNNAHSCFAKGIQISREVQCDTYHVDDKKELEEDNKATDTSKTMFKKARPESPHRDRNTIILKCDAHCLFNIEGICKANGITVNDLGEPYCMSYLKR